MPLRKKPSKLAAVVIPMSNRAELTPDEQISFRHLQHYLGKYDKYLVIPESLQINLPGCENKPFPNTFFGSAAANSRLLLSPPFYESFDDYRFILIYHLDALVFSDQLDRWCERDYDFIGPPWIKLDGAPYSGLPHYEGKVGNGGFSLRKIESMLKVLYSPVLSMDPCEYWKKYHASKSLWHRWVNLPKRFLKRYNRWNNARNEAASYPYNEERFWANRAAHFYPDFRFPSVETALTFGFECAPRTCFEKIGALPFGCHAWPKYDRTFWEPYLMK